MLRLLQKSALVAFALVLATAGGAFATTTNVSISGNLFSPKTVTIKAGDSVKWTNNETGISHTVTSDGTDACCPNGPALYASGTLSPTQTFTFTFNAGGAYSYHCSIHTSMKGTVKTRIQAMPGSGTVTTTFTITWAKTSIPNGYNEDIQIQRPGGTFVNWKTDQKTLSATFTPDGGTGVYKFRARLQQDTTAGHRTGYSPVAQITVN